MLKAKMAGTGVGGTRCLQRSRGQSGVSCVPPMLCRLGQLSPQKSLSALPLLTCWSSFLEHSLCWSLSSLKESAEVTSVEQRWEKGPEMSELPSSHRKHGIEENELQGAGEVLFFLLPFSTSLNLWLPLLTAQHLQKSISTKRILFPRECNCCWWLTGLLRLQTYQDLSAGEVRAANSAKYSHSQGWRLVKMQNTAFDIILLYPKLRNLCCQKSGCHPACLLKPREEIKPKEMIQGSACILFSTVAFQLEEGTRPH